jgi:threonine dehydratase
MRAQVSLEGVQRAREVIAEHLPRTPLIQHPLLLEETGLDLWVKHENHLPTGSFKVRGGFNFIATLPEEQRRRGIVSATRGNHGQSLALASRTFGVRCVIVVPHGNSPEKNAAMRAFGAELIEHGKDFDAAWEKVNALVESEGLTFVHAANNPALINGVGTYSLEIAEDLPDIEAVLIPIGGGSAVCGTIAVFRALNPDVKIIGVQAAGAPSVHDSWKAGKITPGAAPETFADGLATRVPFELPFAIITESIDDIVLVSDEEIRRAVHLLFSATHNIAEGAGAAALAGAIKLSASLKGKRVAVPLSGSNLEVSKLPWVLGEHWK